MKTLRECKSEAAKKAGYTDFEFVPYHLFEEYSDRAAELYASQFREPSTEQSGGTEQDLKIDKAIQYFEELRSDRERNREDDTILITTALIILKGIKRDGRK